MRFIMLRFYCVSIVCFPFKLYALFGHREGGREGGSQEGGAGVSEGSDYRE